MRMHIRGDWAQKKLVWTTLVEKKANFLKMARKYLGPLVRLQNRDGGKNKDAYHNKDEKGESSFDKTNPLRSEKMTTKKGADAGGAQGGNSKKQATEKLPWYQQAEQISEWLHFLLLFWVVRIAESRWPEISQKRHRAGRHRGQSGLEELREHGTFHPIGGTNGAWCGVGWNWNET